MTTKNTQAGVMAFAPGTSVKVIKADLEAAVEQVIVGPNFSLAYTIVYWEGATRKRENVGESEVCPVDSSKQVRIGFVQ